MTARFAFTPTLRETEIRILVDGGILAVDDWSRDAPQKLLPGIDLLRRLEALDAAITAADVALVDNTAIAGLSAREAASLGLPLLAPAVAHVTTAGVITRPDFGATIEWRRATGQPIVGALRTGAFLRIGDEWWRLADALFAIAEAVDALNQAGEDEAKRFASLSNLREALPPAEASGTARATGLAGSMTIAVADAFSLDLQGQGQDARLVPILHRSGGNPNDTLLSEEAQVAFGTRHFNAFGNAKPLYALGGGSYVVLSAPVRRALDVVRRTQAKPLASKRALMASPRSVLREAIGDEVEDTVLENVFRDTDVYSDRVVGLGLWQKRVLPWIALSAADWFGDGPSEVGVPTPRQGGLVVGDQRLPMSAEEADDLRDRIERAIGAGEATVSVKIGDREVAIPASHETLTALHKLEAERTRPTSERDGSALTTPEVLLISTNEDEIDIEGVYRSRRAPQPALPSCIATPLKVHQEEGLTWLQGAYAMGRPGVLLADDMGLGKTLQGLAFLAWLRDGMEAGIVSRAPLAIIAPTGLLQNWKAEEERHLSRPGLGSCLEVFGQGLASLKRPGVDGRPSLDVAAIKQADWILTTYETLRDYDSVFGSVPFAVMLFDEAQKIKTPSVRITDAAKAMNADFKVALTGTPVENRLADLWCITDAVHPAYLGDLKTFSATYERTLDAERMRRLKKTLDEPYGDRPPLLLRRLKRDRLPDLAVPEERTTEALMPTPQRQAYEQALMEARAERGVPGTVLKALQRLRAISLHPEPDMIGDDEAFIRASARCGLAFEALDRIAEANERALIFVDDLTFQARLGGILQRRYGLRSSPAVINGSVPGATRQARVDRFQADASGFDVMILSPRAGGVGLTLTAANHAIHLSRWWNPAVEDQCTGRVLRIGQTRPVFVHLPLAVLAEGRSSFDRNLDELIRRKRQLFQDAFMPPEPTEDEREELFRNTIG